MTDTGQVPGEGLPENAGMVEQPGVPAPEAYTYLSDTPAEEEDLLLHHACVLRQSLARDLAGVGHAYPSPIGWCSYDQLTRNGAPTAPH